MMKDDTKMSPRNFSWLVSILVLMCFLAGCTQNTTIPENIPKTTPIPPEASQIATPPYQDHEMNGKVNLTIHSAFKTREIGGQHPLPGNIFMVVNMTVENQADHEIFPLNRNTINMTGGSPVTQKFYDELANPLRWGPVPPHQKRTGEVVFGVRESTRTFTLVLLGNSHDTILSRDMGTVPEMDYSRSLVGRDLLDSTDFSYVVQNLNTAKIAAQYAQAKFTFAPHGKCTSYPPEEFFRLKTGDCKDYATFLSYVLAYHGYDAKIVAFKYYHGSTRYGHVVTLLTESDGSMKYATAPGVSVWRDVTSIEDLFKKECTRLGVPTIANYTILPPGSVNTCVL